MRRRLAVVSFLLAALLAVLLLASLQTDLFSDWLAMRVAEQLHAALGLDCDIEGLSVELREATIEARGLRLSHAEEGELVAVRRVEVQLKPLQLFGGTLSATRVKIESPRVTLRVEDGTVAGLDHLLKRPRSATSALDFRFDELEVTDGEVRINLPDRLFISLEGVAASATRTGEEYLAEISARSGFADLPGRHLPLERFGLRAAVVPGRLEVRRAEVLLGDLSLFASGEVREAGQERSPELALDSILHLPWALVRSLAPELPRAEGRLVLTGKVSGPLSSLEVEGEVDALGFVVEDRKIGDVHGRFLVDGKQLALKDAIWTGAGGRVLVSVDLDRTEEAPSARVGLRLERIDVRRLASLAGQDQPPVQAELGGRADFQVRLSPELKAFGRVELGVDGLVLERAEPTPWPDSKVKGRLSASRRGLQLEEFELSFGASRLPLSGSIGWDGEIALQVVEGELELADAATPVGLDVAGRGAIDAELSGQLLEPRVWARGSCRELRVGRLTLGDARGELAWDGHRVVLPDLMIRRGKTRIRAAGQLLLDGQPALKADLELEEGRLVDFASLARVLAWPLPELTGRVTGEASLEGPLDAPVGSARITGSEVMIAGEGPGRLDLGLALREGRLLVESAALDLAGGKLTGQGRVEADGRLDLAFSLAGLEVSRLRRFSEGPVPLRAVLRGSALVRGTVDRPEVRAATELVGLRLADAEPVKRASRVVVELREGRVFVEGNLLGPSLSFSSEVELGANRPFWAIVSASELDLAYLAALAGLPLSGRLSGRVEIGGPLLVPKAWEGHVEFPVVELAEEFFPGVFQFALADGLKGMMKDGRLILEPTRIRMLDGEVMATGEISAARGWDVALSGEIGIGFLQPLEPRVFVAARGRGAVRGSVRGALGGPDLLVTVEVADGELMFQHFPHPFQRIDGRVMLSASRVVLDGVRTRLGGGTGIVNGEISYVPFGIHLRADFDDCDIAVPRDIPSRISGEFTVDGTEEHVRLGGDLEVVRARYSRDLRWKDLVPSLQRMFAQQKFARDFEPGEEFVEFAIRLHADDELRIRNNIADIELSGDLTLTGTESRLGLIGTLNLLRGEFRLREHEMELTHAFLDFTDRYRIDPWFDLTATGQIREIQATTTGSTTEQIYDVELHFEGTLGKFERTLTSRPPLTEEDIWSLIMTRVKLSDLADPEKEGVAEQALVSVSSDALLAATGLDEQLREALQLDFFSIMPSWSSTDRGGQLLPRVLVGKELTEDLLLTFESSVGDAKDQKVKLEYHFDEDLALSGQWDNDSVLSSGNFGFELRYRLEF